MNLKDNLKNIAGVRLIGRQVLKLLFCRTFVYTCNDAHPLLRVSQVLHQKFANILTFKFFKYQNLMNFHLIKNKCSTSSNRLRNTAFLNLSKNPWNFQLSGVSFPFTQNVWFFLPFKESNKPFIVILNWKHFGAY